VGTPVVRTLGELWSPYWKNFGAAENPDIKSGLLMLVVLIVSSRSQIVACPASDPISIRDSLLWDKKLLFILE
jgi:hypothetical protein